MPVRAKKILGSIFICIFVLFWIWLAGSLSLFVPDNRVLEMIYYAVAGLGWAVPVMPILFWMETVKKKPKSDSARP